MKLETIEKKLAAGEILTLKPGDWEAVAGDFKVVESHETGMAGQLQIVKRGRKVAAVEHPDPKTVVLRPLSSMAECRGFVCDRMAAYDRMWDG